jgi:hypothetical protein
MSRFIIAPLLLLAAQEAKAAECGSTANRAGCIGANGAAKTPGRFTPHSLAIRTKSHRVRVFKTRMATVRPMRGAFSSMASGFATNLRTRKAQSVTSYSRSER